MTFSPTAKPKTTSPAPGLPMLEWTGERYLPWIRDAAIAYEHLHRYAFAAQLVSGKAVLDLASGEGYGSHMLAQRAASVVGVDIEDRAIEHARAKYARPNLQFQKGSITSRLPVEQDHSFDVVVCFEAIEHVEDHDALLVEVQRVLKPNGLFIVSTPNKEVYQEESSEENPFHVKELSFEEFRTLLSQRFKKIEFMGQRIHAQSSMWNLSNGNSSTVGEFVIARGESEFEFVSNEARTAVYFIALASNGDLPIPASGSVLIDTSDELLRDKEREILELLAARTSLEETTVWQQTQIDDRDNTIGNLKETIAWRERQVEDLSQANATLEKGIAWQKSEVEGLQRTIASHEEALAWRAGVVKELEATTHQLRSSLAHTQEELALTAAKLNSIEGSRGWKAILKLRRLRDRIRRLLRVRD